VGGVAHFIVKCCLIYINIHGFVSGLVVLDMCIVCVLGLMRGLCFTHTHQHSCWGYIVTHSSAPRIAGKGPVLTPPVSTVAASSMVCGVV
jgi:hypothetical protein